MSHEQPSTLARYLFIAYALLVVYASLHPFSGWRDQGVPQFAFLTARFPRPYLPFDLAANLLGYMPLGFLAVLAAHPILRARAEPRAGIAAALPSHPHFLESRSVRQYRRRDNRRARRGCGEQAPAARGRTAGDSRPPVSAGQRDRPRPGPARDVASCPAQPKHAALGTGDLRELFSPPPG